MRACSSKNPSASSTTSLTYYTYALGMEDIRSHSRIFGIRTIIGGKWECLNGRKCRKRS
jgi:hypothetical protein